MVVQCIHLAEGRAHLACFGYEILGQRSEGDETFFQIHTFFTEGDEEVGASVRIDDGLQSNFRLMHLERGRGIDRVVSQSTDEIANHADVGIQGFGRSRTRATETYSFCLGSYRAGGALRTGHLRLRCCPRRRGWRLCSGWRPWRGRGRTLCFQLTELALEKNHAILQITNFLFHGGQGGGLSVCCLLCIRTTSAGNRQSKQELRPFHATS